MRQRAQAGAFTLFELLVVIFIIAILIGLLLPSNNDAIPQAVFYVLAGWAFFLVRVLGEAEFNAVGVASALVCVVLLAVGLHLLGRALYNRADPPRAWRRRWTVAVLSAVVLAFVAGLAAVGLVRHVGWAFSSTERWTTIRGFSPQTMSANTLKQIGIASDNYTDTHAGAFLPGCTFDAQGRLLHGWHTLLLPYIEQDALFKTIDLTRPWDDPKNDTAMRTRVSHYQIYRVEPTTADGYPVSHYAGNVRMLGAAGPRSAKEISDGASNTLLAGEAWGNFKPWGHPAGWRDPALGVRTTRDGFGAPHTGKTQFVLVDGSVRIFSDQASPAVLRALSTPAGGEVIEGDW